jgi:hypothetical protein
MTVQLVLRFLPRFVRRLATYSSLSYDNEFLCGHNYVVSRSFDCLTANKPLHTVPNG